MKLIGVSQIMKETKHKNNYPLRERMWRFACLNKMDVIKVGKGNYFTDSDAKKLVMLLDDYADKHPKNIKNSL